MSTTAEKGAEFIEHFGVKGMRWGVRRDTRPVLGVARRDERNAKFFAKKDARQAEIKKTKLPVSPVQTHVTVGKNRFAKTKIETHGGENHPATPDAIKVAVVRQKYRRSGVNALTNQEMRDLTQRMQLEKQIKDLEGNTLGQHLVESFLADGSKKR